MNIFETTTQFTVADSGKMFYPYQGRMEAALTQGKIMNFPEKLEFFCQLFRANCAWVQLPTC